MIMTVFDYSIVDAMALLSFFERLFKACGWFLNHTLPGNSPGEKLYIYLYLSRERERER